ncbi:MAG: transposase [Pseudorhodobacter sp.]|nr:transposase [Pseudorhodobacter sp.]
MPGVGPIGALAIETFAPPMNQFRRGRDLAAWLGFGSCREVGRNSKVA